MLTSTLVINGTLTISPLSVQPTFELVEPWCYAVVSRVVTCESRLIQVGGQIIIKYLLFSHMMEFTPILFICYVLRWKTKGNLDGLVRYLIICFEVLWNSNHIEVYKLTSATFFHFMLDWTLTVFQSCLIQIL